MADNKRIGRQAEPDGDHVAKIVSAYAKRNPLPADQLPTLIVTVDGAHARIEGGELPEPAKELVPAVPIRRSVQPDVITCSSTKGALRVPVESFRPWDEGRRFQINSKVDAAQP